MTHEELEVIQEIQGSKGWQLMEFLIKQKVASLDSVRDIDGRSETKAGIEALARKKAVTVLEEFLSDIGFTKSVKDSNQTYE